MQNELKFELGIHPRVLYTTTTESDSDKKVMRPLHRHESASELLYILGGEGEYISDGYHYKIGPGDILLYNTGTLHELSSTTEFMLDTYCIGISNLKLRGLPVGHMVRAGDGFVRPAADTPEIKSLISTLFSTMKTDSTYKRELCESLLSSIILMSVNLPADERTIPDNKETLLSMQITRYIDRHFSSDIDLSNIASACNVSLYHASHVYKKETGQSPIQYLIKRRIGEAQNLLISSDLTGEEIACRVGYENYPHFSTIFKKNVGMSPTKYRKYYLKNMKGIRTQ